MSKRKRESNSQKKVSTMVVLVVEIRKEFISNDLNKIQGDV